MRAAGEWMARRQALLYIAAVVAGAVVGLLAPALAPALQTAVSPVLGMLLYATFLGVPLGAIGQALRDGRFLLTAILLNFIVVPLVVLALSRIVAADQALLAGVLFVLLTPCVDYVIVFTGLADGARDRLLAATPILMLGQILLLPVYLGFMADPVLFRVLDVGPFVEAFLLLIVVPLVAAGLTQAAAARTRAGRALERSGLGAMVPLTMLTLAVVVTSQIHGVAQQLEALLLAVPVFILFAVVMVPIGAVAGRIAHLDVPGRRAIVFTGVTRNSLVVLPLVLALPAGLELAALVVVTQTLVELLVMVALVRLVPRLVPSGDARVH